MNNVPTGSSSPAPQAFHCPEGTALADIKEQTLLDQVKITQFEGISGEILKTMDESRTGQISDFGKHRQNICTHMITYVYIYNKHQNVYIHILVYVDVTYNEI